MLDESPTSLPIDKIQACLKFLAAHPIAHSPHSGSTLLCHLVRTQQILAKWGCEEAVCYAGLMHSVYGTRGFDRSTLMCGDRTTVTSIIGIEAEQIVFIYSKMSLESFGRSLQSNNIIDRTHMLQTQQLDLILDYDIFSKLCHLVAANFVEQRDRVLSLNKTNDWLKNLMPFLRNPAKTHLLSGDSAWLQ